MNGFGLAVFVTVNCGATTVTVGVVPTQWAAAGHVVSPPPDAVALLVPLVAVIPTLTFNVSGVLAVGASMPVNVQLSVPVPVQVQFVPLALARVMPVGSESAIVMLPIVVAVPVLLTAIV
jgi:hypothetical protein